MKKNVSEEAPANSVAAGGVAGITGDPPVSSSARRKWINQNAMFRRAPLKEGCFAGKKTFIVPESVIHNTRLQKRHGKWWSTYLPEDAVGYAIREWANANPCEPIILEGEKSGYMVYARYGKR